MGILVVLMGPTGAGKSVQGDILAEKKGWVHLSSGKLLRADAKAMSLMVDGKLAPAEEVERVVGMAMRVVDEDTPIILDGTPRTMHNVKWLDQQLPELRRELVRVILIDLDIETSMRRLGLRGRADDAPEAVRAKWRLFRTITTPVIEYYEERGLLVRVDGSGTIEEVHEEISRVLDALPV